MDPRTTRNVIIDKSGKHGADGRHGSASSGDGMDGTDGQSAKDIDIILNVDSEAKLIYLSSKDDTIAPRILPLGDANAKIHLKAQGGQGGDGGRGGKGDDGCHGMDGSSATAFSTGTNGTDGENGEHGGRGGNGGDGGDGGDITVTFAEEDADLLKLVSPELQGGKGGDGGSGGAGGSGGRGGHGGSAYSWSETHTHIDHEGKSITNTTWRTNVGGQDGRNGHDGSKGAPGKEGRNGHNGHYKIIIPNVGNYTECYDIAIARHQPITSEDGIIEPGETLEIQGITLKNISSMPTPSKIDLSASENNWIGFNPADKLTTINSIAPAALATFAYPLKFYVKPAEKLIPVIDGTFHQKTHVPFRAVLPRVNKEFHTVREQHTGITLRYPVDASIVTHAETITLHEELPFAIKLRNVSTLPIGSDTKTNRPITLQLTAGTHSSDENSLSYFDKTAGQVVGLSNPLCMNMTIPAGQSAYFSGTLHITNPNIAPYTTFNLNFKLSIGSINNYATMHCIQQRNFNFQLADEYRFNPQADFVLVTHCNTKKATVEAWKTLAAAFGTTLSVWNTSLYAGLSYHQTRHDHGSFTTQLRDKVVIILNDAFTIAGKTQQASGFLAQKEMLDAAKSANVATLVIGQSFDIKSAITPPFKSDYFYEKTAISANYSKWGHPTIEHLKAKAEEEAKRLRYKFPTEQYVMELALDPAKISPSGYIIDTWYIGHINIYQSLNTQQTRIAYRQKKDDSVDQQDAFNMLKLLPFYKKLHYLTTCEDIPITLNVVKDAILSDLTDELITFSKSTWLNDLSSDKIEAILTHFNTLEKFDFSFMKNHPFLQVAISKLFIEYKYLASQLPTISDAWWFPWYKRRTILSDNCQKKTTNLLKRYFADCNFEEQEAALAEKWKNTSKEELFRQFSNGHVTGTMYNNHIEVEQMVLKEQVTTSVTKNSFFTEGRHIFKNKEERAACIESYEKRCQFDL